ncbi:putative necrosis-inducing factor-domain-containing protein [Neurospora tetraspora]|uniref:Necrosis-inducing factor-domain-containing protein n=1 Tax=Neurospora tetraspora TaxID=94610 RepID=A0AAE0JPE2_9PEZI|nr:putative necrosis-inducing factor-domain-containing protein [Neurospora tetraspora]
MITYKLIISILLFLSSTVLALPTSTTTTTTNTNTTTTSPSSGFSLPRQISYPTAFIGPRQEEGPQTFCKNYGPVVDQTSEHSPYSVDCKQISINVGAGGSWKWMTGPKQKIIAKYGTCLVGVEGGEGVLWGNWLRTGNEDVVWMIEETLKLPFYNGEKVGSKGTMECSTLTLPHRDFAIKWGVWHT